MTTLHRIALAGLVAAAFLPTAARSAPPVKVAPKAPTSTKLPPTQTTLPSNQTKLDLFRKLGVREATLRPASPFRLSPRVPFRSSSAYLSFDAVMHINASAEFAAINREGNFTVHLRTQPATAYLIDCVVQGSIATAEITEVASGRTTVERPVERQHVTHAVFPGSTSRDVAIAFRKAGGNPNSWDFRGCEITPASTR